MQGHPLQARELLRDRERELADRVDRARAVRAVRAVPAWRRSRRRPSDHVERPLPVHCSMGLEVGR